MPLLPQNIAAQRRSELDQSYLWYETPASPAPAAVSFAVSVVRREASKYGPGTFGTLSEGAFERKGCAISERNHRHLADILRGLMWRGRHQANVFQVFIQLCLHGLCSLSSLGPRIGLEGNAGPLVTWVQRALLTFKGLWPLFDQGSHHVPFDSPRDVDWRSFEAPQRWLAVVIARSATNLHDVFGLIARNGYLGDVDQRALDALPDAPSKDTYPDRNAARTEFRPTAYFGMFLPHGVPLEEDPAQTFQDLHERFYTHLNSFQTAYERFFNVPEEERLSMIDQKNDDVDVSDLKDYERFFDIPGEGRRSTTDQKNGDVDVKDWSTTPPSS